MLNKLLKQIAFAGLVASLFVPQTFATVFVDGPDYSWNTSTVYEGGYDYTEVYYTEEYDPYGDNLGEYLQAHYAEVDGATLIGHHDLEIDQWGGYHAAFIVKEVGVLYAYRPDPSSAWEYDVVYDHIFNSGTANIGIYSDVEMELDSNGEPHIIFNTSHEGIRYARHNGTSWSQWTIATDGSNRNHAFKMRMDSDDHIHFIYEAIDASEDYHLIYNEYNIPTGVLMFPINQTTIDTIYWGDTGTAGRVGFRSVALEYSLDGILSFVYSRNDTGSSFSDVYYGEWDGTAVSFTVDTGVDDNKPKLTLDANEQPHFYVSGSTTIEQYGADWTHTGWSYNLSVPIGAYIYDFDVIERNNGSLAIAHSNYTNTSGTVNYYMGYTDVSQNNLLYQVDETVSFLSGGSVPDLELASPLEPAILYNDSSDPTYLQLTEFTSGDGGDAKVAVDGKVGMYSDIDYDSNGLPHISYYDESGGNLMHAYKDLTGAWVTETVDYSGDVGLYTSIDVDKNDVVHISYYSALTSSGYTSANLKYANNKSGTWDFQNVDVTGLVGKYSSILVDDYDYIHIAYYDETNKNLLYTSTHLAYNMPTSWTTPEIVNGSSSLSVGKYASMDMTSTGDLYIAYYDETDDWLLLSHGTSGSWTQQKADSVTGSGLYASLDIATDDSIHISYYNQSSGNLKYLKTMPGTPITSGLHFHSWEVVDYLDDVGMYSDLSVDNAGHAHISYYDLTNKTLKYAENSDGYWVVDTVDSVSNTGLYTSIVVDDWYRVHIAYFLKSVPSTSIGSDLKYLSF